MKSMPASSAMRARRRQSGQLADHRSGTLVAERPDEQLAPKIPIFSALALYMAMRSRIDAERANTMVSINFRSCNAWWPVGPKLLQHALHERAIDGLVEIDGAFDETLLGVEGEIVCETCFVRPSVRIHAGRGNQFVDVPALDRRRLGQDGNDIVRVCSVEPAVFERAVIKAHSADVGA